MIKSMIITGSILALTSGGPVLDLIETEEMKSNNQHIQRIDKAHKEITSTLSIEKELLSILEIQHEEINDKISKKNEEIKSEEKKQESIEKEIAAEKKRIEAAEKERERVAAEKAKAEAESAAAAQAASSPRAGGGGSAPAGNVFYMESTAYSSDPADLLGGGTVTATGQNLLSNPWAVAVDPNVIPLGSKLWVEGYGYAVASDTGGAIKGNIVDVHFKTAAECIQWGRRQVKVVVL